MSIHREPNSARFIAIFEQVSGMQRSDNFPTETQSPPRNARLGGVIGAVVVGSSTQPNAQPKDLDVVLALTQSPNPRAREWATDTSLEFDLEFSIETGVFGQGRLDVLGLLELSDPKNIDSHLGQALRDATPPLIFAFSREGFETISNFLDSLHF